MSDTTNDVRLRVDALVDPLGETETITPKGQVAETGGAALPEVDVRPRERTPTPPAVRSTPRRRVVAVVALGISALAIHGLRRTAASAPMIEPPRSASAPVPPLPAATSIETVSEQVAGTPSAQAPEHVVDASAAPVVVEPLPRRPVASTTVKSPPAPVSASAGVGAIKPPASKAEEFLRRAE